MDKSWNQLVDRCKLFYDAPDGLYKELLKEGEIELSSKCNLFYQNFSFHFGRDVAQHNAITLPDTFKSVISVWFNGDKLHYKDKSGFDFTKSTDSSDYSMMVGTGTPQYYFIANNQIVLDKCVDSNGSDTLDVFFKANLTNQPHNKSMLFAYADNSLTNDQLFLGTSLGIELVGADFSWYSATTGLHNIELSSYGGIGSSATDINLNNVYDMNQNIEKHSGLGDSSLKHIKLGSMYTVTTELPDPTNERILLMGTLNNYSNYAPMIDSSYHIALCDYALYVASARKEPSLSDKHRMIWEQGIQEILNDNLDRSLSHTIKEVI